MGLSRKLRKQIDRLSEVGNQLGEAERFADARKKFWEAFDLLPDPKEAYRETTWLIVAIGDMFFLEGDMVKARDAFQEAVRLRDGLGNPFIHLRLGEIQFELGDKARAGDELCRAYMGGGEEAFEHEDPKYLRFLGTLIELK